MRTTPRISIVTPSFNQGRYIKETLDSVFEQRYPNLEYILMDGGSSDETLQVVEPYLPRFAHFQSGPDGGQSAAIATGFAKTSGEIMAYLNSDDVLLPGALNYVSQFFEHNPHIDVIYSHRCIVDAGGTIQGHWILPPHSSFLMRRWDLIPQETCFWRRRIFEREGNVDPTYRFAMDYDLFVRFMRSGRFRRVNRFLAAFRMHDEAKTTTQLASIGMEEIRQVYSRYNIRPVRYLGEIFQSSVRIRSAAFAVSGGHYPGLPPGTGFKLRELWG